MLAQAQLIEDADRIRFGNLRGGTVGVERNEYGNEATDDHRIRLAPIADAIGVPLGYEPDLRHAALHPVFRVLLVLAQRWQGLAEFDDVPVPILPVVEEGEVFGDVLKSGRV